MADFLEDQMPPGMVLEIGDFQDPTKVRPVAVQIGRNHDVVRIIAVQADNVSVPERRSSQDLSGFAVTVDRHLGHAGGNTHKLLWDQQLGTRTDWQQFIVVS